MSKRSGGLGPSGGFGRAVIAAVVGGVVLSAIARHAGLSARTSAASANVALGRQMAAAYGWGSGGQWSCLDALWTRESGWSATAANPTSDARGIAQDIRGWSASYPYDDPGQQIAWGLAYIRGRYGTPCTAWAHETSAGWY